MKPFEILAIVFYICVGLFSVYWMHKSLNTSIPCGVAEISPDFSAEDRARCRQMRGHKL